MSTKYAIVYLMGGFGNQLFQLCFAESLKKSDINVYIDTDNYLPKNKRKNVIAENREIIIPIKEFGFEEAPYKLKIIFKINNYLRNYSFKNYKHFPIGRYNDKNLNGDYKKYNQFVGYWQNIELIEKNKDFILNKLSNNKTVSKALGCSPEKGSTALHVRRGDYVEMNEELFESYYVKALNKAEKQIDNFSYDVFTDDEKWVSNNKIFSNAKKIYHSSSSVEDTIKTFAEFLKYENYIISNSTFSLLPAILNNNRSKNIIAPEPWFRNMEKTFKYPSKWIRIKNQ